VGTTHQVSMKSVQRSLRKDILVIYRCISHSQNRIREVLLLLDLKSER